MTATAPARRRASTGAGDAGPLPATKFDVPIVRDDLVERPGLVAAIRPAEATRLALVGAPAGSGKTTLLAQWARAPGTPPVAWVSLDDQDDDAARFCSCLLEGLRRIAPGLGARAEGAVRAGADLVEFVVPLLVSELAALDRPAVIVLDDYHLVSAPPVHRALAHLVERLPVGHQLVVATRHDPPLPLARLRVRRELAEIRAGDLSFSDAEARALLNAGLGLDLDDEDVAELRRRTEGWAAGLQLAGLSLRGRLGASTFIRSFAGDDRQIVDYLGAEVLDALPADTRAFLVRTAVLDRLSGPLCDAVTGTTGATERLERLERDNLFVLPLDDKREHYRYHHLFAELLRHELRRSAPDEVALLHRRASAWHRAHGSPDAAVHHAVAAGDLDDAAALVAGAWADLFNRGRLGTVARWLDALPADAALSDWRLWLARTWSALDAGRLDEARSWLEAAAAGRVAAPQAEDAVRAGAWRTLLEALQCFKAGDVAGAGRALGDRRAAGPPDPFRETVESLLAGVVAYWRGDEAAAAAALEEAARRAAADGNALAELYTLGYLAKAAADAGDLERASAYERRAAEPAEAEPALDEQFPAMFRHLARSALAAAADDRPAALAAAARSEELARRGAGVIERAWALVELGRRHVAAGAPEEAAAALSAAEGALVGARDPGRMAARLRRARREIEPGAPSGRRPDDRDELSDRELAVLRLLPTELSQREIGEVLYVSLNTVKSHVRAIYLKLGTDSRQDAVARARERELI